MIKSVWLKGGDNLSFIDTRLIVTISHYVIQITHLDGSLKKNKSS